MMATDPNAGFGAYGQINLTVSIQRAAALQKTGDLSGASVTTRHMGKRWVGLVGGWSVDTPNQGVGYC